MSDVSDNGKATDDKQTNRTYTQSEADQLVAKILKSELGKYADYGDVKAKLESDYRQQKTVIVRNDILSDKKYAVLPPVYRNNVRLSENVDEVKSSADEMLKQFNADIASVRGTVGAPGSSPAPTEPEKPKSLAELLKERAKARR
jgi:hypothetical protein